MKPVTLLAVCVVLLVMAVPSAIANNAPDDEDWKNDALRTAVFRGEYKAAIHVRYHEKLASKYGESDEQWRWASIVLGVLAFAGPFVFKISREWASVAKAAWYVAGLVALLVAIYATFNGAADRFNREALQEQRWNDLHASWEKLLRERDEIPREELKARVDQLASQEKAIEGAEQPGEAGPELLAAQKEEDHFRGLDKQASK